MANTTGKIVDQILPIFVLIFLMFFFLETILGRKLLSDLFNLISSFLVPTTSNPSNQGSGSSGAGSGNPNPTAPRVPTIPSPNNPLVPNPDIPPQPANGGNTNNPSNPSQPPSGGGGGNPNNPPNPPTYGPNLRQILGIDTTGGFGERPTSPTNPSSTSPTLPPISAGSPPNTIVNTVTAPPPDKNANNNPPKSGLGYVPPSSKAPPIANDIVLTGSRLVQSIFQPVDNLPNSGIYQVTPTAEKTAQQIATGAKAPLTQTQPQPDYVQIYTTTPQDNNPIPASPPNIPEPTVPNPLSQPSPFGQEALNNILAGIGGIPNYLSNLTRAFPIGIPNINVPQAPIEGIPFFG